MIRAGVFFSLLFVATFLPAQYFHFKIAFNEKDTISYKSSVPADFLSSRSINRKNKFNITIDISDFQITKAYLDSLQKTSQVISTSKWMNCAIVSVADSSGIHKIRNLPFVSSALLIGQSDYSFARKSDKLLAQQSSGIDYGTAQVGIDQMEGGYLHDIGAKGEGLLIAVLDAGFVNVDKISTFDSLRSSNRIVATKNFVSRNASVYTSDNHGTFVLSILAANVEGSLVGTAPNAEYVLLLTEDVRQENPIEEYFWIEGIEYADSIGADVVNSSLGYNTFDFNQFNHNINDLYQDQVDITKAANTAWDKGLLIFSGAGNEGNSTWQQTLFPGDASKIITVGGTDSNGNKANFSSIGKAGASNLKPNVAALAVGVGSSAAEGVYSGNSGTSYACPLVAGLSACFWQTYPDMTNNEIKTLIEESATQYQNPDHYLGHGIPNFRMALQKQANNADLQSSSSLLAFPNPVQRGTILTLEDADFNHELLIQFWTLDGQLIVQRKELIVPGSNRVSLKTSFLSNGNYILSLQSNQIIKHQQILVY